MGDAYRSSQLLLGKRLAIALFAVACGLAVANVYYAHPVLDAIAAGFGIDHATIGIGLVLLVPLGDVLDRRRRLIVTRFVLSTVALVVVGPPVDDRAIRRHGHG